MIPTYMIGGDGKWIQCLDCGMISYNPNDVRERYCGNCHEFHEQKEVKAWARECATEAGE